VKYAISIIAMAMATGLAFIIGQILYWLLNTPLHR